MSNEADGYAKGTHCPAPPVEVQVGGDAEEVEELQQEANTEIAEHGVVLNLVSELVPVEADEVALVVKVVGGLVAEQPKGGYRDASGSNREEIELGPNAHVVLFKELMLF